MHDTYCMIRERPGRRATPDHLLSVELEKTHKHTQLQKKFSIKSEFHSTEERPERSEWLQSSKSDRKTPLKLVKLMHSLMLKTFMETHNITLCMLYKITKPGFNTYGDVFVVNC